MQTRSYNSLVEAAELPAARPLHLAIGMFDGVHLGHRAVVETAVQSARRIDGLAAVLTFSPHPSRLFRPEDPVRLIMSDEIKARLLFQLGAEAVVAQPFDAAFAAIEAEELLPYLRRALPGLVAVYVGENWRFGRGRRGDIRMLVAEGKRHRIHVVSAQRINQDGEPISSTRIRACLTAGEIEDANALLGYSYFSEGAVEPGKQLGRTIGFPTLNLSWTPDLRPRLGVYAVRVKRKDAEGHEPGLPAVANYGLRPTVETASRPRLEVHVLGAECPFGVGDKLTVEWLSFLRPERRFDDVAALREQIGRDREKAKEFFLR